MLATAAIAPAAQAASTQAPATAKTAKKDTRSASERRAAGSSFERERLDQGAFKKADQKATAKKDSGGSGSTFRMLFGLVVVLAVRPWGLFGTPER